MDAPDSLTRFATFAAQLTKAFADRAALLSAAGLDETTWAGQMERWTARIAADSSGDLAHRFTAAYTGAPLPPAPSTADVSVPPTVDAPPVVVAPREDPPTPPPVSPPPHVHARSFASASVDETQECPIGQAPAAALPFQASPFAPAPAAPPGKRLHRFDTQTGLPLPTPVWVDIPAPPSPRP